MRNPSKNQSPVPFWFLFRKIKFFKINVFKTKFVMYQTLILWYIPHYFPKVWYYIFISLLINTININNNKPLLIPDVIRNYIVLKMEHQAFSVYIEQLSVYIELLEVILNCSVPVFLKSVYTEMLGIILNSSVYTLNVWVYTLKCIPNTSMLAMIAIFWIPGRDD